MRDIGKSFPGVRALDGVTLELFSGEVLALVGENGAGKSTLMKVLSGAQPADRGEILIGGSVVLIDSPVAAELLGIGMIYQEFNLVPALDAIENIVLGVEPQNGLFLNRKKAAQIATEALAQLGITMPLDVESSRLSVAQQQMVEIAKALSKNTRIIVMDEPTAALTEREIDKLFGIIKKLITSGVGIIYISHRLEELPRIADRIAVMRDGRMVETRDASAFSQPDVIRAMVGRALEAQFPELPPIEEHAPLVLEVNNLTRDPAVHDVSFSLRAGEIVGLAGLVGAGRTEIVRAIAGADVPNAGTVRVSGKTVEVHSPSGGIEAGIALITEDRKGQGLVLGMTVRENITLAHLEQFVNGDQFLNRPREMEAAQKYIGELRIRTPGTEQVVRNLSGGNQQKVVLAKWLVGHAKVFLFDEPTRGIDVGSKAEIYTLMVSLVQNGAGIVMVSSELPELLGMAHRVLVVRGGRIQAEFSRERATPEAIIAVAAGAAA